MTLLGIMLVWPYVFLVLPLPIPRSLNKNLKQTQFLNCREEYPLTIFLLRKWNWLWLSLALSHLLSLFWSPINQLFLLKMITKTLKVGLGNGWPGCFLCLDQSVGRLKACTQKKWKIILIFKNIFRASFHLCVEAITKKEQQKLEVLAEIGAIQALKDRFGLFSSCEIEKRNQTVSLNIYYFHFIMPILYNFSVHLVLMSYQLNSQVKPSPL